MMRFIVDCLRPARARAAAAQRDSVELKAQVKDSSDNTDIKELKDALQEEEEALEKVKALRCDTQQAVERLEEKKSQLSNQLEMMQNLEEQERKVLQSLQEEQQELEQTIQQYDAKLRAVNDNVLQLQEEVACAKAHAENMRVRIAPLQDSFEEILQVKKKLDELIAGLTTDKHSVNDIPQEAVCQNVDVLEDDFDRDYQDENGSQEKEEVDHVVKQDRAVDEPDQMQRSTENLKSSGSSSFTEITLTEVKEEYVMFRSTSPQLDSSDIDEEDFEMVQPRQRIDRQFDFFHPNPFTDGDVFGDDHFPKADVTERLPSDPFKGTDPFASDVLFVDISKERFRQDSFITGEQSLPETVHCPLQSVGKDRDYGTFNTPVNLPLDAQFKQSTGKLDRRASVPTESKSPNYRTNTCPEVGVQMFYALQPNQSVEVVSSQPDEVFKSVQSHSSSESDSFDGDCSTFLVEGEEDRLQVGSLCGLQKIIAGSYTEFPLSPCEPEPHPGINDTDQTFEHQCIITSDKDCCDSELDNAMSSTQDFNNPGPSCEELRDINRDTSSHPSALDASDYKYGDMYFFTVRLDPGSPELHNPSPVCPESSEVKKCGSLEQFPWNDNSLSPEFNNAGQFKSYTPKPEDSKQQSLSRYDNKSVDRVEMDIATNSPLPQCSGLLESDSEMGNVHVPRLTFDNANVFESVLNPESNDQWKAEHILDSSVQDTECSTPLKSTEQDLFSLLINTETSVTDQLCDLEKHSLESCCEWLAVSKSELQYFDPFSPISTESNHFEDGTINCHDASRLDSGYHEVDTPTAFNQDPVETSKYNFALQDPCLETSKESNCEFHISDPFSPKSVDTGIFESEIENCESDYMMSNCQSFSPQTSYMDSSNPDEKPTCFSDSVSCDMLIDHYKVSEHDDCYPFSPFPHKKESYNGDSFEENVIAGLPGERPPASGETKPSCMASNGQSSQVIHCGSASEISLPNADMFKSMKHSLFEFDHTAFGSCLPSTSEQAEDVPNHTDNVTKMSDLANIDYFCSELSKMVSSRSSDSVQQSVTEMLFGSEPNTCSFYPWEFENQQCNS